MNKLVKSAALLVMLFPAAGASQNQQLTPLSDYLALPINNQEMSYPFLRCAGLLRGFDEYGGANLSKEDASRSRASSDALSVLALVLRLQKFPSDQSNSVALQIGKEILTMTKLYYDRMTANYTLTGQAFGSDQVIMDDFDTCMQFSRMALDFTEKSK